MTDIKTIDEFIEHYKNGVRLFTELEFENGGSFSGLDITGTVFKNCWLDVNFTNTNLTDCKFIDSNIKCSDFSHSNLTRAEIRGCSIEATEYEGAIITDLIFEDNSAYGTIVNLELFKEIYGFVK